MPDIRSSTVAGHATLVTERIGAVRSVGLTWLLPAGIARDPDDRVGRAPLFAELLLRGAGDRDARADADAFDLLGASRSTGVETFTLSLRATLLGANLDDTLPRLVDTVRAPRFDPAQIPPALDLCRQTIESLRDDPQERVMLNLRARHAPPPVNRSIHGSAEGLANIDPGELAGDWADAAVPGGSVIAIAGDVDHDRAHAALESLLSGWAGEAPDVDFDPDDAPRGVTHEDDQTDQTHIAVAYDAPPETARECWLERVATAVLSGGMSGRLFTEVRERRALCYSVHASYGAEARYGRTVAYAGTTPDRAQETLDVLLAELRRLGEPAGRVTPEEFERAVVGLKSRLVFSGESSGARAGALAHDVRKTGRPRSLDELARAIDAVTLDDLNDYLGARDLGRLTVATVGPKPLQAPTV